MPRPSLLQVVVVLLVAMLGLMAVSAAYRARSQRSATTTAAQPAAAVPAAPALEPGARHTGAPAARGRGPLLQAVAPRKARAEAAAQLLDRARARRLLGG